MNIDSDSMTTFCIVIILVVIGFVVTPLLILWSLNALFGLGLAYSIKNWLATLLLLLISRQSVKITRS